MLTDLEHQTLGLLGQVAGAFNEIMGVTRQADSAEVVSHIHALQRMIASQAAARAYPERYRLLGEVVTEVEVISSEDDR